MCVPAKIVNGTKHQGTRGMAPCILLSCPILHGILYSWTSSSNFLFPKVALLYGLSLTVLQKWHTSYLLRKKRRRQRAVQSFSCQTSGDYMGYRPALCRIATRSLPVRLGRVDEE